jgi:aminomethyltransferase
MIALQGQASQATLQEMTRDLDLASIGYYKFGFGTVSGIANMRVSRTGYTGEDGFELYIPKSEAARVWNECLAHGTKLGLKPIGLGARDTLRLEAGMPLYGHEIDATHNPIEAGLEFGVSFKPEKGDWIGRAALEKFAARKTRHLVGVRTEGPRVPRQGYELFAGKERLGEIVSGSVSPTIGANIGTGYVPMSHGEAGSPVEIDIKGKRQAATFCAIPFFSRTRK